MGARDAKDGEAGVKSDESKARARLEGRDFAFEAKSPGLRRHRVAF